MSLDFWMVEENMISFFFRKRKAKGGSILNITKILSCQEINEKYDVK
jgi:hypothetical protein